MTKDSIHALTVRLGKKGFPTSAQFECTYRCNAQCDYCYTDRSIQDLSTQEVFTVLEKLNDAGILTLVLTGGEPFVREDILHILDKALSLNFFKIGLMSNGIALNSEHLKFLSRHAARISSISVSIFSHQPHINDAIIGIKGALQTSLYNCEFLMKSGIPVRPKINLRPDNISTYKETKDMLEKRGFIVEVYPYTALQPAYDDTTISTDPLNHYANCIHEMGADYFQFKGKSNSSYPRSLCTGLYTNITINPAGDIRPCVPFKNTFKMNILEEKSLRDILQSSAVLQRLKATKRSDIKSCAECAYIDCCIPCPARLYNHDETLENMPPLFCEQTNCYMKMRQKGVCG